MIYNQKLHFDELKGKAETKMLELVEWQARFDRANDAYQQALIDIDNKDNENAQLVEKIEVRIPLCLLPPLSFLFFTFLDLSSTNLLKSTLGIRKVPRHPARPARVCARNGAS